MTRRRGGAKRLGFGGAKIVHIKTRARWHIVLAGVPTALADLWIPAFAGMTGKREGGNDGGRKYEKVFDKSRILQKAESPARRAALARGAPPS